MLDYLLQDIIPYPMLGTIINGVYYSLIFIAMAAGLYGSYRTFISIGYEKKRLNKFFLLLVTVTYPLLIIGGRAANMFYYPAHMWGWKFFVQQLISGRLITFHAGMIVTGIVFIVLIRIMGYEMRRTLDTFFVFIPLGHAIGRVGCLMAGCCWGREISLSLFGSIYTFDNPVPLYSIILNLALFYFLRFCHRTVYMNGEVSELRGIIAAMYLLGYGNIRMILEHFRTEIPVFMGFTQAQVVMGFFMVTGGIAALTIITGYAVTRKYGNNDKAIIRVRRYRSLGGIALYFTLLSTVSYVLLESSIVAWPFHRIDSVQSAYKTILEYAPVVLIAALTVPWLWYSRLSVKRLLSWNRFSMSFLAGFFCAALYSFFILHTVRFGIDSPAFWPPVIILSALNAVSEEIIFRLVIFSLLRSVIKYRAVPHIIQAFLYSLIHIFIGGIIFGFLSFVFGLVLGYVMERNESIIPPVICHFIIDLGVIGAPLLTI